MEIRQRTGKSWVAVAAASWALLFAGVSFYWAAGGAVGLATVGDVSQKMPDTVVWLTGLLKLIAAGLALSLLRPTKRWRLWTAGVWATGLVCTAYGIANLGARGLMAIGVIGTPVAMHSEVARWHLFLWDPWWLIGGLMFLAAAWLPLARKSL